MYLQFLPSPKSDWEPITFRGCLNPKPYLTCLLLPAEDLKATQEKAGLYKSGWSAADMEKDILPLFSLLLFL